MDDKNFALLAIGILTFAAASMMAKGFASPFLSFDHVFFMTGSGILIGLSAGLLLTEVLDHGHPDDLFEMDKSDQEILMEALLEPHDEGEIKEKLDPETIDMGDSDD